MSSARNWEDQIYISFYKSQYHKSYVHSSQIHKAMNQGAEEVQQKWLYPVEYITFYFYQCML